MSEAEGDQKPLEAAAPNDKDQVTGDPETQAVENLEASEATDDQPASESPDADVAPVAEEQAPDAIPDSALPEQEKSETPPAPEQGAEPPAPEKDNLTDDKHDETSSEPKTDEPVAPSPEKAPSDPTAGEGDQPYGGHQTAEGNTGGSDDGAAAAAVPSSSQPSSGPGSRRSSVVSVSKKSSTASAKSASRKSSVGSAGSGTAAGSRTSVTRSKASGGSTPKPGSRASVEKPPSGSQASVEKPPSGSQASVEKPPSDSQASVKKPPSGSQASVEKSPSGSQTSVEKPPSGSQESVKKPPSGSQTSVEKPPSGSQASVKKPPSGSQTSVEKPPSGSQASVEKPPSGSQTSVEKPPSGSQASVEKPPSGSQTSVEKPASGASVTSKAGSEASVKKQTSAAGSDGVGAGPDGSPTPKKAPSSGSQGDPAKVGSKTNVKKTPGPDSQEAVAKPGSTASTAKVGSRGQMQKTDSKMSSKKPPSGAGSQSIVKKTSSKGEPGTPKKSVSGGRVKRTGSKAADSGEPAAETTSKEEPTSSSASVEKTASHLTGSGSRTSRRSRTSIRSQPKEEVWVPPEYNSQDFVSGAILSEFCALNEDTLIFVHSFGYDCLKPDNLCMLDSSTAMFVSGNLLHFINLETKAIAYMRSSTGGGIGHATVHPSYKYMAVAEKGDKPNVLLYRWPEKTVYRVLRDGTEKEYAYVAFSANGDLLCSQGGDPDYMLTVWNWETESTLLRCKAFSQDIYKVTFSPFHPGQLTSAGLGHIKFWKMARTFTGLKLQGRLGRFGKTEISDINGFLQLPDGKVVSGCEWGNILVWDDALIKVEITRRDNKPCHNGTVHKFYLEEGELISLGSDGWVRTWDFDTVDQAEPSDETTGRFALDPMNELRFSPNSSLVSMWPHPNPEMESIWFVQDGCGGIWRADLSFAMTTKPPELMYECPAGPVRALATCPTGTLLAVTGDDGNVSIYNYRTRDLLVRDRYPAGGNCLIWLTQEICGMTCALLGGFADGCIRLLELHAGTKKGSYGMSLLFVQKPHTARITVIKQSPSGRMLVTGSDDGTVWFFSLLMEADKFTVAPLGFAPYGEPTESVSCLEFVPGSEKKFLLFTSRGRVVEMRTPGVKDLTDHTTFGIKGVRGRSWVFKTVKSEILREEARLAREEEKEKQRKALQEDIDERKKVGVEVEEENEKAKLEKRLLAEDREIPEIPLVVPDPPSPVLVGVPAADHTFTLLMDGWDAGWVHKAGFREPRPSAVRVPGAQDVGISVRRFSPDGLYLVLGMCDGRIRIHTVQEDNPWFLDDYWILSMHDNTYGRVTDIQFTYDQRNIITSGTDGNVFLFDFNPPEGMARPRSSKIVLLGPPEERVDDIDDPQSYSLEEQRQRSARDARLQLAEERKTAVKTELAELRRDFKQWIVQNQGLPDPIALSRDELLLDERIRAEQRRRAEENLETAKKEMEWEADKYRLGRQKLYDRFKSLIEFDRVVVRAFKNKREVWTFRVKTLSDSFLEAKESTESNISHLDVAAVSKAGSSEVTSRSRLTATADPDANRFERMSLSARRQTRKSVGIRAYRALLRLEEKKTKRRRRRTMWANMMMRKPDGTADDPADLAAIQQAVDSMGDFKLKTAADFKVVDSRQNTTHLKRHKLISVKEQIYMHKRAFNERVLMLRQRKTGVLRELCASLNRAIELQKQLPPALHVPLPVQPQLAEDESPEAIFEIKDDALAEYRKVAAAAAAIAHEDPAVVAAQAQAATAAAAAAAAAENSVTESTAATATPIGTLRRRSLLRARHQTQHEPVVQRAKPTVQHSDVEQALARVSEVRKVFARDQELLKMDKLIAEFDEQVYELWKEMVGIEYQLKSADLRLITRFRELVLVREFEKQEAALNRVLQQKMEEDTEGQLTLSEVTQRFETIKRDQEEAEQSLKDLAKEVASNIPGDKYAKFLLRVYKKKIKRKSEVKKDDDDDSDSSSSLSDSDDDDDEDEDEDEEDTVQESWDLSACPPGCDPQLYDWVSQMRLKRGDLELELADKRLAFDVVKKEFDAAQKKASGASMALQTSREEIHAFQLQKLARLNELEVAVSLHLSQLQLLQDGCLPDDISDGLVFWDSELERLAVRIDQLYAETAEQKSRRRASYKEEKRLKQDCRLMEEYIVKLEKQCLVEMKKKFGRLVDLEELESLSVNETVEELRIRLENEQHDLDLERAERKEKISQLRNELISVVRENTEKVGVIQMLQDEKRHLDKGLNFIRKAGVAPHDKRLDDAAEIEHLMNTISLQKTQIMELKQEIWSLSLKSRPYRDPCPAAASESGSSEEPDFIESQCSEDFLRQIGVVPGPGGSASLRSSQLGSGDARPAPSAGSAPTLPSDGSRSGSGRARSSAAGPTPATSGGASVLTSAGSRATAAVTGDSVAAGPLPSAVDSAGGGVNDRTADSESVRQSGSEAEAREEQTPPAGDGAGSEAPSVAAAASVSASGAVLNPADVLGGEPAGDVETTKVADTQSPTESPDMAALFEEGMVAAGTDQPEEEVATGTPGTGLSPPGEVSDADAVGEQAPVGEELPSSEGVQPSEEVDVAPEAAVTGEGEAVPQVPASDESPVGEQTATAEEAPPVEGEPLPKEASANVDTFPRNGGDNAGSGEVPKSEEAAAREEAGNNEEISAGRGTPTGEEEAASGDAAAGDKVAESDGQPPVSQDAAEDGEAPAGETTPAAEEAPVEEEALAHDEKPAE